MKPERAPAKGGKSSGPLLLEAAGRLRARYAGTPADLAAALSGQNFRAYTSPDIVGVEVGGAVDGPAALATTAASPHPVGRTSAIAGEAGQGAGADGAADPGGDVSGSLLAVEEDGGGSRDRRRRAGELSGQLTHRRLRR